MQLREFQKHPGTRITAILFALWFLFNQGKMTALGLFGGKPGHMFTCASVVDIAAGIFVHGVILFICAGVGCQHFEHRGLDSEETQDLVFERNVLER